MAWGRKPNKRKDNPGFAEATKCAVEIVPGHWIFLRIRASVRGRDSLDEDAMRSRPGSVRKPDTDGKDARVAWTRNAN